jgi:GT2 family glycosyltransferase
MNQNHVKIGIVTVTYNSAEVILEFMESLLCQTFTNWVLYCVDNQSKDQTISILESYEDSRIHIIKNGNNIGVAAGNNQGILQSKENNCNHILLINNDVKFNSSLIGLLLEGMNITKASIVTPKIFYFNPKNILWYAGGGFEILRFWSNKHYGMGKTDSKKYNITRRVDYAPTCCVLIKNEVFNKIGLMDENFFIYFDDVDFFYRAKKGKIKTYYIPKAELLHKVSSLTGGASSKFGIHITARNAVYFIRKHSFGLRYLLALYTQKITIYLGFLLLKTDFNHFCVKQSGYFDGLKMIRSKIYKS